MRRVFGDPYYVQVIFNSLKLAFITTAIALALGYPAAFALARAKGTTQVILFALVFLPLTVSIIVKTFGLMIMFRREGIVNWLLVTLGFVDRPIRLVFTEFSLIVGMVNVFLPFMILPIYSVVRMLDPRLTDAAASLGAGPVRTFCRVTLPLTMPGIDRGRLDRVLDRGRGLRHARPADRRALHDHVAGDGQGLPQSARLPARRHHGQHHAGDRAGHRVRVVLPGARREPELTMRFGRIFSAVMLTLVLLFLALPILTVIPISFSASPVFSFPPQGFSLRWYANIRNADSVLSALWLSAQIAFLSTCISLVIGTLAAIAIVRD